MSIAKCLIDSLTRLPNVKCKVRLLRGLCKLLNVPKSNARFLHSLHKPTPFKCYLDLESNHELMAYLMNGYEADTIELLDKLYDPSGYFLDIGANIGLISIPFAKMQNKKNHQNKADIYCVEAVVSNVATLEQNIRENGLEDQVTVLSLGLGEKDKLVEISVEGNRKSGQGTGTANVMPEHSDFKCERIKLSITTVDTLVTEARLPKKCSLIKLDTDGYDLFIMRGAEKLLKESRPVVYGEFAEHCLNWHSQSVSDVNEFMQALNYTVLAKSEGGWVFNKRFETKTYIIDLLLVPNEKLEQVSQLIDRRS